MADESEITSPVEDTGSAGESGTSPEDGMALCLSGGGYRAMLFHTGSLLRLNELGLLPSLKRVSSVSGGSITAAVLGMNWSALTFDGNGIATNLVEQLVRPIQKLASKTIDDSSVLGGLFGPGSIADKIADRYEDVLYGKRTLQDLPDEPRFVINATSVQTGALVRFSKPYLADYKIGQILRPTVSLAVAVGASSAFPPVLSPARLELDPATWAPAGRGPLHQEPYTTDMVLTDGGVYDNLGLETSWKRYRTILVSDGGGLMSPEPEPKGDWAQHAIRINSIIDNQVRSLRKRQVIGSFLKKERLGAYWGIRSDAANYFPPSAGDLPCPVEKTLILANTKTRLKRLDEPNQNHIMNWGYAVCDLALRRWLIPTATRPQAFPFPEGVG